MRTPLHASCGLIVLFLMAPFLHAQTAVFSLSGSQEVPRLESDSSGSCVGAIDDEDDVFLIRCTHNVPDPIAAHIHRGAAGTNGPILFPFDSGDSPLEGSMPLDDTVVVELVNGLLYVNVHSMANPPGEVRGQIRVLPDAGLETIFFDGDASQQTQAVTSDAILRCGLQNGGLDRLSRIACFHDVENVIAAHIHNAPAGQDGPIVVDFGAAFAPILFEFQMDQALLDALRSGELYVNVHSTDFPPGEVRGQIVGCFADDTTLCLSDNRFQVTVDWMSADAAGAGNSVVQSDESGTFWFFDPENFELQVKVLDACAISDRFWVFAAATTNVEFTLTVTDTQTGDFKVYTNPLGMAAQPIQDTSAFATCP